MTKNWEYLNKGDKIRIIATGSIYPHWEKSAEIIKDFGFSPLMDPNLCVCNNDIIPFANSYEYRCKSLIHALYEDDCKAIWPIAGGHGTPILLNALRDLIPPERTKLIIGYSDITALHIFFNQKWNWPTLHASAPLKLNQHIVNNRLDIYNKSKDELTNILMGQKTEIFYDKLEIVNYSSNNIITGKIIGGNLSLIQRSLGTFWQIDTKNKILFIEDIDEPIRKIDAILTQFEQADMFKNIKAVIFGDFQFSKEQFTDSQKEESDLKILIKKFSKNKNFPVLIIRDIGHKLNNNPLFLNITATLDLNNASLLVKNND